MLQPRSPSGNTEHTRVIVSILDKYTTAKSPMHGYRFAVDELQALIDQTATNRCLESRIDVYKQVLDNMHHLNFKDYIVELYHQDLKALKAQLEKDKP